ncbi:MAG: chemotaxis protein CheC [Archaeoglobaceae archaeon]
MDRLSFDKIGSEELDALKELGNIGVAHAATSLSVMLGKLVEMSVPNVKIIKISEIHRELQDKIVTGIVTALEDMENGRSGYLYIMFPDAKKLVSLLVEDSMLIDSTVIEIGNILSSSFCNAIADMLGITLIPSPPNLAEDASVAIIEAIIAQIAERSDYVIIFETQLKEEDDAIEVLITLIPDEKFLGYIMKMFGMLG